MTFLDEGSKGIAGFILVPVSIRRVELFHRLSSRFDNGVIALATLRWPLEALSPSSLSLPLSYSSFALFAVLVQALYRIAWGCT